MPSIKETLDQMFRETPAGKAISITNGERLAAEEAGLLTLVSRDPQGSGVFALRLSYSFGGEDREFICSVTE